MLQVLCASLCSSKAQLRIAFKNSSEWQLEIMFCRRPTDEFKTHVHIRLKRHS